MALASASSPSSAAELTSPAPLSRHRPRQHWACLNGHRPVVTLLLSHGASPTAVNSHDRTPVDEALSCNHGEVVEAINSHIDSKGGVGSTGEAIGDDEFDDDEGDGEDAEDAQ